MIKSRFTSLSVWAALIVAWMTMLFGSTAEAQRIPPADISPNLRLLPDYPLSRIREIVFTPDGQRLYAGGWDKVIHCWVRNGQNWTYRKDMVLRVPIGGEMDGAISTIAISSDGNLLAAGGKSPKRGIAGQRDRGVSMSAATLTREQKLDEGLIYVFDLKTGKIKILRGHEGAIFALSFAPKQATASTDVLISAAELYNETDKSHGQVIAWDVSAERPLAELNSFTDEARGESLKLPEVNKGMLPQLCPLSNSNGTVSVALSWSTWPDSGFGLRLWDIQRNELSPSLRGDPGIYYSLINATVDDDRPAFIAGSANRTTGVGELARWELHSAKALDIQRDRTLIKSLELQELPLRIKPYNDKMLVLVYDMSTRAGDANGVRGRLLEVGGSRPYASVVRLTLKSNDFCFANCPGTNAVAWEQNGNGVRVADITRFTGNNDLMRAARSPIFDLVEFVERNGAMGIRLTSTAEKTSKVLDFENNRITTITGEWKSAPSRSPWSIRHEVGDDGITYRLTNSQAADQTQVIRAFCDEVAPIYTHVGASVFNLPEFGPFFVAAFNCNSQPNIGVYDLKTGRLVRRYSAHTGPLTGIGLSADEKMLVTSARDGTIRVWWLPSLADHVGTTGAIRDGDDTLSTSAEGDRLVVRSDCGPLRAGDVINECRHGDDSIVPQTSVQLAKWLLKIKPGESILVDTSRGGKNVRIGQAIDWHRELFALYVQDGPQIHWIAWTPQGIYDFNESAVKDELGWHFNTGNPEAPVRYATVDAYPENHKRGFLKELCEAGQLTAQAVQPPEPTLIWEGTPQGFASFNRPGEPVQAKFLLTGEFPSGYIKGVEWIIHANEIELGRGVAAYGEYEENSWSINTVIPENLTKSGYYQLTAVARTADTLNVRLSDSVEFRYQRPAPELKLETEIPRTTASGKLEAKLRVTSPSRCAVELTVASFDKDNAAVESFQVSLPDGNEESIQDVTIALAEGYNKIVVTAVNQDALSGFEENETHHLSQSLFSKTSADDSSPQLSSLSARPATGSDSAAVDLFSVKTTELHSQKVTISGEATCKSELKSIVLKLADDVIPVMHRLTDDADGYKYAFQSDVSLSLGEQSLTLILVDDKDQRAEPQYAVTYLPPLPELEKLQVVLSPLTKTDETQGMTISPGNLRLIDGVHDATVQISSVLRRRGGEPSFEEGDLKVVAILDGEELKTTEKDVVGDTISMSLSISEGASRSVALKVKDRWGRTVTSNSETIVRVSRPSIEMNALPTSVDRGELPAIELLLSAPGWDLQPERFLIRIAVNGIRLPMNEDASYEVERDGDDAFRFVLSKIPLQVGARENHVQVILTCRGEGIHSGAVLENFPLIDTRIVVNQSVSDRRIDILTENLPDAIALDRLTGKVEIESTSELRYVKFSWNNDNREKSYTDPAEINRHKQWTENRAKTTYLFEEVVDDLTPGETEVVIFAASADGFARATKIINYVPSPPIAGGVEVRGLDTAEWTMVHSFAERGDIAPQTVTSSQLELQCKLETLSAGTKIEPISVWVNGFFQGSLIFPRTDTRELMSRPLTVHLSRPTNRIELHGLPQDVQTKNYFEVRCASPVESQELFFVLIDATRDEEHLLTETALKEKAKAAISAYSNDEQNLVSAAFDRIENLYVFTGRDVTKRQIFKALGEIQSKAKPLNRKSAIRPLPVTIFYYHGRERKISSTSASFELLVHGSDWESTSEPQNSREITDAQLAGKLNEIGGAHLVFLDVDTIAETDRWQARWPNYTNLGVFRVVRQAAVTGETVAGEPVERMPLITRMGEKIKQSPYLIDLSENLKTVFDGRRNLAYDFNIPEMLKNLTIYRGDERP